MSSFGQRVAGALIFGFLLIFAFAFFVQLTADLINWIFHMHVQFLLPHGLMHAFEDIPTLVRVLTSLVFSALVAATIFFVVKLRRHRGVFDLGDDDAQDG
jgi:hypothetical protein